MLFRSHTEPVKGGKEKLLSYMQKIPPYSDSGETILYQTDIHKLDMVQGTRSDLQMISELIADGNTPAEIMRMKISFRKYEKLIYGAYRDKRLNESPLIKNMHREWHVGESRTGKTYLYTQLCQKYSRNQIYVASDMGKGWLDYYMSQGCPDILFVDDIKGNGSWSELLAILDVYSTKQIHCRYEDAYAFWNQVYLTSVYPPEEIFEMLVPPEKRDHDTFDQLLNRLDVIVYHYRKDGEYREFRLPADQYTNYADLKRMAEKADPST